MIIDLSGVDATPRKYIKTEGHYTLKCVQVKEAGKTSNGNPILKFFFQNKEDELYIEDVVLTPDTRFRIKQMADAFGFTYDKVNIYHFVGMYLVAYLVKDKVKNRNDEMVEVIKCRAFTKSAKLENNIPAENTTPVVVEQNQSNIPEIDVNDEIIPFWDNKWDTF